MLVKTFEGFSMTEAMRAVKKELGSDAIILSTSEKLLENGKLKVVEVKAATAQPSTSVTSEPNTQLDVDKIKYRLDRIEYTNERILDRVNSDQFYEQIFDHLREIKLILSTNDLHKDIPDLDLNEHLGKLYQQLFINGVAKNHLIELFKHLQSSEKSEKEEIKNFSNIEEFYRSHAIRWMLKKIKILPIQKPNAGKTQIHALVGPTGCGKTTILTKLAAFYKKQNVKILMISFDTMKVGGNELLRIHSKILGCEYKSIESIKDLSNILLEFRDIPLILIDTGGKNPKCSKDLEDLRLLANSEIPMEVHLVLPAIEKSIQLDRYVNYFSCIGLESIIFSKIDSCWQFGDLFNISHKWSLPLSFFSTGQKVPEDFERASRERVIEKIFGL